MIKQESIEKLEDLYIKYSITIDLDTLEIIHQKLLHSGYNKIEYKLSAHKTRYTCENIEDLRNVFVREGLSEIHELEMDCKDKDYKKAIAITFKEYRLLFDTHFLRIHPADSESQNIAEEIFSILNERNLYNLKRFAGKIINLQKMAYCLLFTDLILTLSINTLPDSHRNYARLLTLILLVFSVFVIQFSSKQKVKICTKRDTSTLEYRDITINLIISIAGSFIVYLITKYF